MFSQFVRADNVYMSMISGYSLYVDSGESSETISHNHAIHVTQINSEEECYLVKLNIAHHSFCLNDWIDVILKPANKSFFWPIDIVIKNDDYYLVFLRKFIPEIKSICDFSIEENFLGLEQKHIKKLTSNFLLACNSLYKHSFLFHIWNERRIYVNKKDYSLLIAFSDFTSKGFDKKEHLNNNEYMSENIDPYAFTGECLYDYYSEMYSIASILFKLLIGRYPYEGSLMDGIPKCSDSGCINSWDIDKDNDFKYWVNQYVSHPIFIFDNCDDRNAIGRLAHEKICLQRWDSLTERVKNMFCSVFSEGNVLRTNNNLISYSPMEWFEEIQKFEFKLK
nr:hypothetical protein [uncultured Ruminococcus sp.]